MKMKHTLLLSIVTLLLSAFTGPVSVAPVGVTGYQDVSSPIISTSVAYTGQAIEASTPSTSIYSTSSTSTTAGPSLSASSYAPQPGDARLTRDKVFLDFASSGLVFGKTLPLQVIVQFKGYMSDPCHQLRIVQQPASSRNRISLDVYSVFDPTTSCITRIQPFEVFYPLGSFKAGHYQVYVNGQLLGEFDA